MKFEAAVSKTSRIKNVPYSSQCFSITIGIDDDQVNLENLKEKSEAIHDYLEFLVDARLNINQSKEVSTPIRKPKIASQRQINLINKLIELDAGLDFDDLQHVIENAYCKRNLSELTTIEASSVIRSLIAKDLTQI